MGNGCLLLKPDMIRESTEIERFEGCEPKREAFTGLKRTIALSSLDGSSKSSVTPPPTSGGISTSSSSIIGGNSAS
jgi:hypothetical protein